MAESWTPKDDYSPSNHNHDDKYYTETEVDAKLSALKNEILAAGIDMLPVGTIMWFKQSVALSNKWQVYQPLIGRYPLGATSGLGNTVEAGLPNITGHAPLHTNANVHKNYDYTGSALYRTNKSAGYYEASEGTTGDITYFDASRSNPIYGNSDTVTPPSTRLIPYVKIA